MQYVKIMSVVESKMHNMSESSNIFSKSEVSHYLKVGMLCITIPYLMSTDRF